MPLLSSYPVLSLAAPLDDQTRDSRSLAFESLDGQLLLPATGREFFIQEGIDGLGIPQRELIRKRVPGLDGSKLKEIRTGEREIFLPLFMENDSSHTHYLQDADQLAGLFNYRGVDYQANDGTLNLVAYSQRDGVDTVRRLRCAYLAGMDTGYGTDNEGSTWASLGLKFLVVQPYYYGDRWTTSVFRQSVFPGWFGTWPGQLADSQRLNESVQVTVEGDAESWITVDLVGPATAVTISGSGVLVSIPGGLASGEPASIITDPRGPRAAKFSGVTDWTRVGPATKWKPLAPGDRELTIAITGVGSTTTAVVSGPTLYERPW